MLLLSAPFSPASWSLEAVTEPHAQTLPPTPRPLLALSPGFTEGLSFLQFETRPWGFLLPCSGLIKTSSLQGLFSSYMEISAGHHLGNWKHFFLQLLSKLNQIGSYIWFPLVGQLLLCPRCPPLTWLHPRRFCCSLCCREEAFCLPWGLLVRGSFLSLPL